jgi:hypothetical protein
MHRLRPLRRRRAEGALPKLWRGTGAQATPSRIASRPPSRIDETHCQGRRLRGTGEVNVRVIESTDRYVVREMVLAPGEAMYWHVDPCRRFSVVLGGDRLSIEFMDPAAAREDFHVYRGLAGWDEPEPRVHRAVNTGREPFVEIVRFLRESASQVVQPEFTSPAH